VVKEGNQVKNYKVRKGDPELISVSGKVYFPEIDDEGTIDLGNWSLTKEEAELKERWYKFVRKLNEEYDRLEKRKREYWELTIDELGIDLSDIKRIKFISAEKEPEQARAVEAKTKAS